VAVGQLAPTEDARDNWETAERLIIQAAGQGASLLVLPEQTMLAQRAGAPERFTALAREAWGWWPEALAAAARDHAIAVIAGGFAALTAANLDGPASASLAQAVPSEDAAGPDARPWNVLVAVDADGQTVACRPKTRLYDAFTYRESDLVRPGTAAGRSPFMLAGLRLGMVNCYELRFPECARSLALDGAGVLALGAAWTRGPAKEDQWQTLARARAIENCAYVLASATRTKDTIGRSMIIDPIGTIRAGLGGEPEGLALAQIDTAAIETARDQAGSVRR
jgi:predicted amidohydrolase